MSVCQNRCVTKTGKEAMVSVNLMPSTLLCPQLLRRASSQEDELDAEWGRLRQSREISQVP